MAEKTAIEWCDATFNPWWGCTKVSPACDHCYAERDAHRYAPGRVLWGAHSERRTFGDAHWEAPRRWARTMPAKLGRRPRVFCASMADVFDKQGPAGERERLFELIRVTPELDWLLLTKRPQNIVRMVRSEGSIAGNGTRYLPDNAWLGTTVEDQERANINVPALLRCRAELGARVLFLSIEPMLGPVDLTSIRIPLAGASYSTCNVLISKSSLDRGAPRSSIDWVICGGESGPHARPMHPDWPRSLRDQCAAAGVPFLMKQWGEWVPADVDGHTVVPVTEIVGDVQWDEGKRVRTQWLSPNGGIVGHQHVRLGKKAAGRLLDGVEHNGFPEADHA